MSLLTDECMLWQLSNTLNCCCAAFTTLQHFPQGPRYSEGDVPRQRREQLAELHDQVLACINQSAERSNLPAAAVGAGDAVAAYAALAARVPSMVQVRTIHVCNRV
jgi:hypothetical protein